MDEAIPSAEAGDAPDTLAAALARHQIELPPAQVAALERYANRLWDWNTRLNLTRHTTYEKFVARDVVDSVRLAKQLELNEKILDVGTGGGVPGIVIAILRPDVKVKLCDSVAKKAKAVQAIAKEAGLNIPVLHARAEELLASQAFQSLVIRAVAPLSKLLTWFKPHWNNIGRLLIIKGPSWVEERGEARHRGLFHGLELRKKDAYPLVGTDSESVILEITPNENHKQQLATERANRQTSEKLPKNNPRTAAKTPFKKRPFRHRPDKRGKV